MRILMSKLFFLLGLGVFSAFVGQAQENPKTTEPTSAAKELPASDAPAAPVDPKTYRIGPEDIISIMVWREKEMSGMFIVRPDGRITLPLAGELTVADLSPLEVQDKVTELYSKFINKPEVSVALARVGSKKYYLVGQVLKAGIFPLVVPITILEAINASGGFQEYANKKKIVILRGDQRLKFNYEDVIKGKKMEQNIPVQNGDHIIVQ